MASEEHLRLSNEIKSLHKILRVKTKKFGAKKAWRDHLEAKEKLKKYALAMKELAVNHWEVNDRKSTAKQNGQSQQRSRISWSVNYCREYFSKCDLITGIRQREIRILDELQIDTTEMKSLASAEKWAIERIKLLDVGSCYNPFAAFPDFDVTAIDIAPANEDVYECDFLNAEVVDDSQINAKESKHRKIDKLPRNSFDAVVFSLLLEYLPTSEQRLKCCEKAYDLLRSEGVLIIITPDSKHVGANAKLMKTWRYALGLMGFGRVKYEKLEHISCMVFRKCFDGEVSRRWARMHKESYMDFKIEIPQDSNAHYESESNEEPTEGEMVEDEGNPSESNDLASKLEC